MFVVALALALLGLCLILWLAHKASRHSTEDNEYAVERSLMPDELATAKLVLSEQRYRCERPDYLVTRLDQAFLTTDGYLVPLETKTRPRPTVYESDRVQLGVTAVVLANAAHPYRHHPVATHGYVRLVTPDGVTYRRVSLPDTEEVLRLAARRRELLAGKGPPPRAASHPALCPKCPSRARCPQPSR